MRAHLSRAMFSALVALTMLFSLLGYSPAAARPVESPQEDSFAHYTGMLQPGETVQPIYQLFGLPSLNVNLETQVPAVAGDGSIQLAVTDGAGSTAFANTILDGETLWANTTLTVGVNRFSLHNPTTLPLQYDLWLYYVPSDPYSWSGASQGAGEWASHVRLNFQTSGLYTFGFGTSQGRYQFELEDAYLQKTVESAGEVAYYVPAGQHLITVTQDTLLGATWGVQITASGATADTLPYHKTGGNLGGVGNDFTEEWLPVSLASASPVNLRLALTGQAGDALDVEVYAGSATTPLYTIPGVYGGEALWWTMNLPAGLSRIHLAGVAGNVATLAYDLTLAAQPNTPITWNGVSAQNGHHPHVRFNVPQEGLFNFQYGLGGGRYQFVVDDQFIQKTAEQTGSVIYYLPAGVHDLLLFQDSTAGTTSWSMDITPSGAVTDTLPYQKSGGELGGVGNGFTEEWLPLYLDSAAEVNFQMTLAGDLDDGLRAYLYHGETLVYTSPLVYGGETFWGTTELITGENHIQLVAAGGNAAPLEYQLTILPLPADTYTWNGEAKRNAGNSAMRFEASSAGIYHVRLDTPVGFAQVHVDGLADKDNQPALTSGHATEFDVPLSAGIHHLAVLQDALYITTTWSLLVAPSTANELIAQFSGTLVDGYPVHPQIPLFGTLDKKVNFRLQLPGNDGSGIVDLVVVDGNGTPNGVATVREGETVWGTAILKPGINTFSLAIHNPGSADLPYDLKVYEVGAAPYNWAGRSRGPSGDSSSHIRLEFPSSGLYTFGFGQESGRYQFTIDDEYIQKTVETEGAITYFVPAGEHLITVVEDSYTGANWNMEISASGAQTDTLPYHKAGGNLGGSQPLDFDTEWLPINLETATPVNFRLALTGTPTATMDILVYSGLGEATPAYTITNVHGGETVWWSTDLGAGISRISLKAHGGHLAYDLKLDAAPETPMSWSGVSLGYGNLSFLRFIAPQAGLYDFNYAAGTGRYQFLVSAANVAIAKTVETSGTVRYYLPAGMHRLIVFQDLVQPQTAWSLSIAPAGVATDSLPYAKEGGDLGGLGNVFTQESLPIYLNGAQQANFSLTLDGALGDGLVAYLYQGYTPVYTSPVLYGGETFWWNTELAMGANQLQLVAQNGNVAPLQYHLSVQAVPVLTQATPMVWSGLSKGSGGNSEVRLHAPVNAMYHVKLDVLSGFANILIANAPAGLQPRAGESVIEFDVPLGEGDYLFDIQQSTGYTTTSWTATVSVKSTLPPEITAVTPMTITNEAPAEVVIVGANFQPGAQVFISTTQLVSVTVVNASEIHVIIPAGMAPDVYDVKVVNPDNGWDVLEGGLAITLRVYRMYMPLMLRLEP